MDVTRRKFVISSSMLPLAAFPARVAGFEENAKTVFIVLEGIGEALAPALVEQVLNVFFAAGIPVTATLSCTKSQSDRGEFASLLKKTLAREPGLFELAFDTDLTGGAERYFHLRRAIDLRDCLLGESETNGSGVSPTIVSILNRGPQDLLDPFALRAAGFRIQMRPQLSETKEIESADGSFEVIDWGLARVNGGLVAPIGSHPEQALSALQPINNAQVLYLSFAEAAHTSSPSLLAQCRVWATRLQSAMMIENTFLTRPVDHLLQGNPGASKYVGLVLDLNSTSANQDAMETFAKRLDFSGFPYTTLISNEDAPRPDQSDACIVFSQENSVSLCVYAMEELADLPSPSTSTEIVLKRSDDPYFWNGPRSDGRFYAALKTEGAEHFAELLEEDPLTDVIFSINPSHIETPIQQDALLAQLDQARNDGKAHFYSVSEYVEQTVAPDNVLKRYWSTKRRQESDPADPRLPMSDDAEKERLIADAKLAWRFIEKHSHEETGMCAGTVLTGRVNIANQGITLWDVASQLNGIIAAQALGIVAMDDAQERVERILTHLPVVTLDGIALPPSLFNADDAISLRQEFDACDTGRFLIALHRLVESGLVLRERAEEVLGQWDLASAVQDERPFNFVDGGWRDVSVSHCTQYSRNGYIAWGMPVASPFAKLNPDATADDHLRLLYRAALIGQFGTEPLLLEDLEIGVSRETRYMSDVLFDAQLSWFEETGKYKCISETALDFSPWFVYQGLRVDRSGQDEWVVSTISGSAEFQTSRFFDRADIISSKAAYLWAAAYPHTYSASLLELIRKQARIDDLGFSIGVFSNTQQAMKGYSDVNTNGIILTAIAQILHAPKVPQE